MKFKELHNDQVFLRPMEKSDMEGIFKVAIHSEIWPYLSVTLETFEDVQKYVETALTNKKLGIEFPFVMIDPKTQEIIGSTRFMAIEPKHNRLEIGFTWLTPAYWRTAMNTNCKYLLLQYCFEELHLNRVEIKTDHENIRAQKAIERIGAQREGILRSHMIRKDGTTRDTVMYSIIYKDWNNTKKRLEKMRQDDALKLKR
ncbi:GNAT family N-acetyltransferase [Rummeliibacillus sp. SL167]|uniref:GNAT family N-acetyltransferase n=1 Tax=Rummeliibacillus sp. SL167 TaxID=2579792 RepID=UPI0011B5B230|nr:GNAT family protein [Rummeliibacillus sp. SL167]